MITVGSENGTGKREAYEREKVAIDAISRMRTNLHIVRSAGFKVTMTLVTPGGVKEVRIIDSIDTLIEDNNPRINLDDPNSDPKKCDT